MYEVRGRLPTIPEYYMMFIDKATDLISNPKQCCPFHKENTPSFSYSAEKEVWRCFGACNCGGDVVDLHAKKFGIRSRKEAEHSIKAMFAVKEVAEAKIDATTIIVNADRVTLEQLYQKACLLAGTAGRWAELDYIMSIYPLEAGRLSDLLGKWAPEDRRDTV